MSSNGNVQARSRASKALVSGLLAGMVIGGGITGAVWLAAGSESPAELDASIACDTIRDFEQKKAGHGSRIIAGTFFAGAAARTDPDYRPLLEAFQRLSKATEITAPDANAVPGALAGVVTACDATRGLF